jgi:hypothetical protein
MIQEDIDAELQGQLVQITEKERELELLDNAMEHMRTPRAVVESYALFLETRKTAGNRVRKETDRQLQRIRDEHRTIDADVVQVQRYRGIAVELAQLQKGFESTETFLGANIDIILGFLQREGFIAKEQQEQGDDKYVTTRRGFVATHLREVHCLAFALLLESGEIDALDTNLLIGLFSCFTNVSVAEEDRAYGPIHSAGAAFTSILSRVDAIYEQHRRFECSHQINTGTDYVLQYDLVNYAIEWTEARSAEECKFVLEKLEKEKGIFLGEFVKAILKINNIAFELEKVAESMGNMELLAKLKAIPAKTQKFVATNQSLYV